MILARVATLIVCGTSWFCVAQRACAVSPEKALAEKVPLDLIDYPVEEFLDYLQDYCKVRIELDEAVRDRKDLPLTANCKDLPLRDTLGIVLEGAELTYSVEADRIVVRALNPGLPLSEWGHLLEREDAFEGWISLFDGRTTFGWDGAKLSEGCLAGGATTSKFGDYEIRVRVDEAGALELAGEKVAVTRGMFRRKVTGNAAPIRLLGATRRAAVRPPKIDRDGGAANKQAKTTLGAGVAIWPASAGSETKGRTQRSLSVRKRQEVQSLLHEKVRKPSPVTSPGVPASGCNDEDPDQRAVDGGAPAAGHCVDSQ